MFRVTQRIVLTIRENMENDHKQFDLLSISFSLENFWIIQPTEWTTTGKKENDHKRFVLQSISFNRGTSLATLLIKSTMGQRRFDGT